MTMQYFYGDEDQPTPGASKPPRDVASPIQEIGIALRVVARLVEELPGGAHTSRLGVAVESAQAAAAAHPAARRPKS